LTNKGPTLFYDGECKFCSASVMFILKNEINQEIKFAHLQESTVADFIKKTTSKELADSIYFLDNHKIYSHSDATIHLAKYLKSPYYNLSYLKIIPRPIRNWIYKVIARYRKKIMGVQQCIYPKQLEGRIENFSDS